MLKRVKSFLNQSKRIMTIASKPDKQEYRDYSKVIALGVLVLGVFGFIIYTIFTLLAPLGI